MATERQIKANRPSALKCTGPKTPEGQRISSRNAALLGLVSGTIVLKGESMRRYNDRWRLPRTWGIKTAGFEMEMAKTREKSGDDAGSAAVLALQHALEASYGRQYNQALAMLLKLRETSAYSHIQLATETCDDDIQIETNLERQT